MLSGGKLEAFLWMLGASPAVSPSLLLEHALEYYAEYGLGMDVRGVFGAQKGEP